MRMRSTGLGKTELLGEFENLEKKGDYLILHVKTTEPVRWHVRTAISPRDLLKVIKMMISGKVIKFLLFGPKNTDEHEPLDF
jgi:hypothetical protein